MLNHLYSRRSLYFVSLTGIMLALLVTFSVAGTFAENAPFASELSSLLQGTPAPSVTPPDGPITLDDPLPACQMYYVSAASAPVRTCAGSDCDLVETLAQYSVVCVRGIADNPDWLIVSLTTEDITAPLSAIEAQNVTPGQTPSLTDQFEDCFEFWQVADVVTANVNVRQCPSETCPVLGTLSPGDWVCVYDYGGEYQDWLRADIPYGIRGVWISDQVMEPLETNPLDAEAATPQTAVPQSTATPATGEAACETYVIDVAGATGGNVRSCASTNCDIVATLAQGSALCVLGQADAAGWLTVDLTPNNPDDALVYISEQVVRVSDATGDFTQTFLPTATPLPTQPVCEPGSALAECVTMTPTPILTAVPVVEAIGPLLAQEVPLSNLRVPTLDLVSPVGFTQFRFYIPDDWVADGNNVLYLNLDYFETQGTVQTDVGLLELVSSLDVYLDDQLISAARLDETTAGNQTLAIPLPLSILGNQDERSHTIQLRFRAEDHCLLNATSQAVISSEKSYFHFEFRESRPVMDLALYPRPIYNQRFISGTESVIIVLPDAPTEADYKTAMALSAGLGYLTDNDIRIQLETPATLSNADRSTNNLMLVGQIGTNALIDQFYAQGVYPSTVGNDQLTVDGLVVGTDQGVVQIIEHPENEKLAIITVTGQSPEALAKAGQALAGPPSILGIGGEITIISDTNPVIHPPAGVTIDTAMTFEQLGYDQINLGGYGLSTADVNFYMPASYQLTEDAYIDLVFNYASVLEESRTSIVVTLNDDTPLASSYLQQGNQAITTDSVAASGLASGGPYHLRARIPTNAVVPGTVNTLQIAVNVDGDWECYPPDISIAWVTIQNDSVIDLVREPITYDQSLPLVGSFPSPFNDQVDLRNLMVVLSTEPSLDEVEQAMQVVARVGDSVQSGEGFAPEISLGDIGSGIDLSSYHLIVFGRNTTNPFLAGLNDKLPQPFLTGTDDIKQILDDVAFRLPSGYEVGLLEMLRSPWNTERNILVISGTGPLGQANAAAALSEFKYGRVELLGNVVFVSDYSVSPVDTSLYEQDEEVVQALADLQAEATAQALITPSVTPTNTLEPGSGALTVTPYPTMSPTPTFTPGPTDTPTPIFTFTPVPTVPSPVPTLPPLPAEEIKGEKLTPPGWFFFLVLFTGIIVLATLVYSFLKMRGQGRSNV